MSSSTCTTIRNTATGTWSGEILDAFFVTICSCAPNMKTCRSRSTNGKWSYSRCGKIQRNSMKETAKEQNVGKGLVFS